MTGIGSAARNSALKDFTLIVPTFNRHDHLRRLLKYYESLDLPMKLLVLDSSEPEARGRNRELITALGGRVEYADFPSDMPVATKLKLGIGRVASPYCGFCADDDLVFPAGLIAALEHLQNNHEYVCVDGIYLNYWKVGQDVNMRLEYSGAGIGALHPCARVFRLMQKYESLFYGVFRTQDLLKIFTGVSEIPSLHFQELFQAVSALLLGKSHRLPIFYAARHSCEPAQPERDKWQTYYWFSENRSEFIDHYAAYREDLWNFYESHGITPKLTHEAFTKAMDLSHTVFFSVNCPQWYFFSELKALWPEDVFQNCISGTEAVDQLKSLKWVEKEGRVARLIARLKDMIKRQSVAGAVDELNAVARAATKNKWNCVLHNDLDWLANVTEFRDGYIALCRHLDFGVEG